MGLCRFAAAITSASVGGGASIKDVLAEIRPCNKAIVLLHHSDLLAQGLVLTNGR